jgi:uncharacterized membrane protein
MMVARITLLSFFSASYFGQCIVSADAKKARSQKAKNVVAPLNTLLILVIIIIIIIIYYPEP